MKTLENIKTWIRHNSALVVAIGICVVLTVYGYGCQITTESPFTEKPVSRQELQLEAEQYAQKLELAFQDLDKKEAIVNAVLEAGLAYASGGGVNPIGLASTLLGILGAGAVIDNRKKNSVILSKSNALAQMAEALKVRSENV